MNTHKFTSGVVCKFGNELISWLSQKHPPLSLSITESEYIASSEAGKGLVWLLRLLNVVVIEELPIPVLYIDSASTVKLIKNPEILKRTKHIDV